MGQAGDGIERKDEGNGLCVCVWGGQWKLSWGRGKAQEIGREEGCVYVCVWSRWKISWGRGKRGKSAEKR